MFTEEEIKNEYNLVCQETIENFSKKQDLNFDGWLADTPNVVGMFSTKTEPQELYMFKLIDIMIDINKRTEKGKIIEWYKQPDEEFVRYIEFVNGIVFSD